MFAEFCVLSTVACKHVRQLILLIFLSYKHILVTVINLSLSDRLFIGAFPFTHGISLIEQLYPLLDGYFIGGFQEDYTQLPFHCNYRFRFVIPEHTLSFVYLRCHFYSYVSATDDKT